MPIRRVNNKHLLADFELLFKIVAVFSLLLIAFSLCYYLLFFLTGREHKWWETARGRERAVIACLGEAQESYQQQWDNACQRIDEGKNCTLLTDTAAIMDARLVGWKDEFFRRYPPATITY